MGMDFFGVGSVKNPKDSLEKITGFLCGKLIDPAMFQVEWENLGEQKPIFHNNHVLWEGKTRLGGWRHGFQVAKWQLKREFSKGFVATNISEPTSSTVEMQHVLSTENIIGATRPDGFQ